MSLFFVILNDRIMNYSEYERLHVSDSLDQAMALNEFIIALAKKNNDIKN